MLIQHVMIDNLSSDTSYTFYQTYYLMDSREIEILLKNGNSIKGRIIGHIYGDQDNGETFIHSWHIITDENQLGVDSFGFDEGAKILHSEILQVNFSMDKSSMSFV